ncbi:MAG: hypothetical protein ABIF06_02345 [bacterium]
MKIIGLDLDDVLLNFNDAFLEFHNHNYNTNHRRKDIKSYYQEDFWEIKKQEIQKRLNEFYYSLFHKNASPVEGAVEAIAELSKNNTLHIITASPQEIEKEIKHWLKQHFKNNFDSVHFARKSIFDKDVKSKKDFCKNLKIEVFVDDALHNAEDVASIGIPVFLFDTPWNQGELKPLITRVYSWGEIINNL